MSPEIEAVAILTCIIAGFAAFFALVNWILNEINKPPSPPECPPHGNHYYLVIGFYDKDRETGEFTPYTGTFTGRTYRLARCKRCGEKVYNYVEPYEGLEYGSVPVHHE